MGISYLGFAVSTIIYMALLLSALIVFIIIWIFFEIKRQKKYNQLIRKLKKAEIRLIG